MTIEKPSTLTQDLTDLELGEDPDGIEVSPRIRSTKNNNAIKLTNSSEDIDSPDDEPTLKPLKTDTDVEIGITKDPLSKEPQEKTHGFWLLSNKTFTYLHIAVNSFILLSLILQLIVIAFKTNKLRALKKYALLFLVLLTSAINVVVALWVLYGQYLFSQVPRLRQLINMLRMQVNRMMKENNILSNNITHLQQEQERLYKVEEQLQVIVTSQGGNVQQFQNLVKENSTIIQRQKHIIKEQWKQEIIATVLRTDRNGDFMITDHEVDMLLRRIESLEVEAGIKLSPEEEEKLRRILTTAGTEGGKIGSVRALIELIGNALEA